MKTKVLSNVQAYEALELGCVVSVWSKTFGVEMSRGFGPGTPREREPDLRIVPDLGDDPDHPKNSGRNEVFALTPDGEAYLDLLDEHQGDCAC